jgi:hypothetical protein
MSAKKKELFLFPETQRYDDGEKKSIDEKL